MPAASYRIHQVELVFALLLAVSCGAVSAQTDNTDSIRPYSGNRYYCAEQTEPVRRRVALKIAFIERHQTEVIEKILHHCGLWDEPSARAPPSARSRLPAEAQDEGNPWSGRLAREAGHPLGGEARPRRPVPLAFAAKETDPRLHPDRFSGGIAIPAAAVREVRDAALLARLPKPEDSSLRLDEIRLVVVWACGKRA